MTKQTIEVTVKRGAVSIGLIGAGAALALVLLLGACKDDSASQSGAGLNDAAAESADGLAPVDGGQDGSSGNVVEPDHGNDPGDADEPVAPEDAEEDPEPTVTPDGDGGCQFCPEDVDDLAPQPTPTPDGGCNFCPEDVDDLAPQPTPTDEPGCQFCPEDLDELLPVPTPTEEPECNLCPDDPIIVPNW